MLELVYQIGAGTRQKILARHCRGSIAKKIVLSSCSYMHWQTKTVAVGTKLDTNVCTRLANERRAGATVWNLPLCPNLTCFAP